MERTQEDDVKDYPTTKLRNIVLIGHGGSGKTSLAEALLYDMKSIPRMGSTGAGSLVLDFTPAEHNRKISIQLATGFGEWRECKITLIDTPGFDDFVAEVTAALAVADGAILVLNGVSGMESGAERTFHMVRERNLPAMVAVNMMDKENAGFDRALARAQEILTPKIVPLQIPIGEGPEFRGIVDLFKMKAYFHTSADSAPKEGEIPAELQERAAAARDSLIEAVAEFDDAVIEKYLEGEALTDVEILSALRKGVGKGGAFPALAASAVQNAGVRRLLDAAVVCFPSPAERPPVKARKGEEEIELTADPEGPLAAQVFKTVVEQHLGELSMIRVTSGSLSSGTEVFNATRASSQKLGQLYALQGHDRREVPRLAAGEIGAAVKLKDTHTGDVLSVKANPILLPPLVFPQTVAKEAIVPVRKGDEDKIGLALHKIMEEDPTVRLEGDPELHQQILFAMGELHMEVVLEKLRERNVEVELKKPRIHFRETIKKKAEGQGRYKKQTGGRGQYGDVWLRMEPLAKNGGFEFHDKVVGGAVPNKFIPAVEKGVVEAMKSGTVAGYPVVDISVTIYDGSYHAVDSSENAFKVAGSMAFKKLMAEASPALLEPIVELEVTVPDDYTGDVMGDLSSRRGRILGMTPAGNGQTVKALVPEAEIYHYSAQLRSITQGRGRFTMKFHAYEEIPRESADRIIEDARASRVESEG